MRTTTGRTARTTRARSRRLTAIAGAALLAAPLVVGLPGGTAAAAVDPVISPTQGERAVQHSLPVFVSGQAPADGAITAARLVGTEVDGDRPAQDVERRLLRPAGDSNDSQFLTNDGGTLRGQLVLGCLFGPPVPAGFDCAHDAVRTVQLEVTVRTASGATETGLSNPLRVDFTKPEVREPVLEEPTLLRVRFSEPVHHPQGELPTDWRVTRVAEDGSRSTVTVVAVLDPDRDPAPRRGPDCVYGPADDATAGDKGCSRFLRLGAALGEDERPDVEYINTDGRVPTRQTYRDYARNTSFRNTFHTALDAIRPVRPDVDAVAGTPTSAEPASGRGTSGSVAVSNVLAGHQVRAQLTSPSGQVLVSDWTTVPQGQSGVAVPLPQVLTEQGAYTVEAVARDAAGNLSTEDQKATGVNRTDGRRSRVTYVLDSIAPHLLSAVSDGDRTVTVTWHEAVRPDGGTPSEWKVRHGVAQTETVTVTAVSGSGATRRLTLSGPVPAGATVTHEPASDASRYTDAVGNPAERGPVAVDGVALPVVTSPSAPVVVGTSTTTVTGLAKAATLVEVHRDRDDDGQPDPASVVARQQLAEGQSEFRLDLPLTADAQNSFVVTATEAATGITSRPADVPTVTQDSTPPAVTVSIPNPQSAYAGGSDLQVDYTVTEANPGDVVLELSTDAGATWAVVAAGSSSSGKKSERVRLPSVNTDQAVVRVTATDEVDRVGQAAISFVIDAVPPRFTARTGPDRRTVTVTFSETLFDERGVHRGADWVVGGSRAVSATPTGGSADGTRVTGLRLTTASDLGPNDRPEVRYEPVVGPPVDEPLHDRARQPFLSRIEQAVDGIVPAVPTVREPATSQLTRAQSVRVAGTAEPGSVVEVRRGDAVAARSRTVPADGTWAVVVPLVVDADNDLRAVATDTGGNLSAPTAVVRVTQDASPPAIAIDAPTSGTRLEPGSEAVITWRTSDRHPRELPVTLLYSTDGGSNYTVIARDQAPSSSYRWTVPAAQTERAVVRVDAVDALGNAAAVTTGFLGIGQPPAQGSPPPPPPPAVEAAVVTLKAMTQKITAGNAPELRGQAVDASGAPVVGEPVRLFEKVWGSSAYTAADTDGLVTDDAGRFSLRVRPDRQRAYVAQVGAAKSRSTVIAVSNRINVAAPTGGATLPGGTVTVVGDLDPDFASVPIGIATLSQGRFRYVTQGVTDRSGAFSIPVRGLPRGDYALVVYTSARLGTLAGAASRAVHVR